MVLSENIVGVIDQVGRCHHHIVSLAQGLPHVSVAGEAGRAGAEGIVLFGLIQVAGVDAADLDVAPVAARRCLFIDLLRLGGEVGDAAHSRYLFLREVGIRRDRRLQIFHGIEETEQ